MKGRVFLGILLTVILIGVLAGLGALVYNQGMTAGLAANGNVTVTAPAMTAPYVHPGYLFHPWGWGWFGFPIFGLLVGLFVLFLILGAIRHLFFPGHWRRDFYGGWGMHHHGHGWRDFDRDQVPPIVEEWHRKMHENPQGKTPDENTAK